MDINGWLCWAGAMAHSYLPKWYNDLPKAKYTSSVIIQNWFKESYGHVPNLGKCLRFCWVVNFAPYPYVHNKFWFQPSLKLVIIHIHTYIHHIHMVVYPTLWLYIYTPLYTHCMVKLWLYIYRIWMLGCSPSLGRAPCLPTSDVAGCS